MQKVIVLDFGAQYGQLIARRVRDLRVYSEIMPCDTPASEIAEAAPSALILSGGPASVRDPGAPACDPAIYALGVPVLGICYGMQMTAHLLGGAVERAREREYGRVRVAMEGGARLLGYYGTDAEVTVPETFEGENLLEIGPSAFEGKTFITRVTLPDTVQRIGAAAFKGCTSLKRMNN